LRPGDISLNSRNAFGPFDAGVLALLKTKDILFGNLETVLSNQTAGIEKAVLVHVKPEEARFLSQAGFDVLNVANNHSFDLGYDGFRETLGVLRERQFSVVGLGESYEQGNFVLVEKKALHVVSWDLAIPRRLLTGKRLFSQLMRNRYSVRYKARNRVVII